MIKVGFEPTPFRTSALSWRLRPLGHLTNVGLLLYGPPFSYLTDKESTNAKQHVVEKYELVLNLRRES